MDVAARRSGQRCRDGLSCGRAAVTTAAAVLARLLLALGGFGGGAGGVQRQDHRSFGDPIAFLDRDRGDPACGGAGHLHRRLVGFQFDKRLLLGNLVAHGDQKGDDRHILEIADVGNLDVHVSALLHSMIRRTSPSRCFSVAAKRAANAPSMARWS